MAIHLYDLGANCTKSVEIYNDIYSNVDATSLLQQLAIHSNISRAVISAQLHDTDFIRELSLGISQVCGSTLCTSLRFTGNADIAGIGAIIAYGLVAVLAIIFFLIGYRYEARMTRTGYDELADSYFVSLMYFGMSAQIAFWAYLPKMRTLYELTIGLLITRMIACGIALTFWGLKRPFNTLEVALIPIGLCGSTALAIFSFFVSDYATNHSFIDVQCSSTYTVALALIKASAGLYLFCALLVIIDLSIASQSTRFKAWLENVALMHVSVRGWFNLAFAITELMLLVATLGLIVFVREHAKNIFGRSYGDNAMGYGQIMAIGFCIQTVFQAGDLALGKYRGLRSEEVGGEKRRDSVVSGIQKASQYWVEYRFKTVRDHHLRTEPGD